MHFTVPAPHHSYTFHQAVIASLPKTQKTDTHTNIHISLSMPPTFIPIIGTDSEDGEAYVSIFIHIDFIGCLCKRWLVIVHVTDKNTNICRVWKSKNKKEWERKREKGDYKHEVVLILSTWTWTSVYLSLDHNNLVTFLPVCMHTHLYTNCARPHTCR